MTSSLLPIFLVVAVDILGLSLIMPLLPFYAESMGASPFEVGLLISSFAACQFVAGPILGRISDRAGRRRVLLLSQIGTLAGFVILAVADRLWLVFLSRVIDGLTAGNISIAQAYIADVTRPEKRAQAFAVIGIAFGLGFLVGPGVSGLLSSFGYVYPVLAACALSAASIAATYFLLPEARPGAGQGTRAASLVDWRSYLEYFRRPELGPLLAQFLIFSFAFSMFMAGYPLFAERRYQHGPPQVGYFYSYIGLLGILLQGNIGRLVGRVGEVTLIRTGFLATAAAFVILAPATGLTALIICGALSAIGMSIVRPPLTSRISGQVGGAEQGSVIGLTQSINSISHIAAPALAGFLIQHGRLAGWALVGAAISAAGLLPAAIATRYRRPRPGP